MKACFDMEIVELWRLGTDRMRRLALLGLILILPVPAAIAADHFDVVSVRPAEMPRPIRRHSPTRIEYEGIGFGELITKAFAMRRDLVVWPEWVWDAPRTHPPKEKLDPRYFTIMATMPPETNASEFQLMLQNLLVERFGLAFHRETRPLARYELTFAAGSPKMSRAKPVLDGPLPTLPEDNEDLVRTKHASTTQVLFGNDQMTVKGDHTVAGIAAQFSQFLRHPMIDQTGSTEYFDLDFTWGWNPYSTPPFAPGMINVATDGDARQLFSEMEKKLGLKVTLRTVPTEFLVIDRLNHEATEN